MSPITIHGAVIDPQQPPEDLDLHDASNTNYALIQTTHPLNRKEYAELAAKGAQALELIDQNNTYRCRYEPHDLSTVEELSFVKHAIIYHQDFVLHDLLKDVDASEPHPSLQIVSSGNSNGQPVCRVHIYLHEAVPAKGDKFFNDLSQKLHDDFQTIEIFRHDDSLELLLPLSSLEAVASMDQVMAIKPVTEASLQTIEACNIVGINPWTTGLFAWSNRILGSSSAGSSSRYDGSGEVVAVYDTGFNLGVGLGVQMHPAFDGCIVNRVRVQSIPIDIGEGDQELWENETLTLEDQHYESHGTFVAGVLVGHPWNHSYNPVQTVLSQENFDMLGAAPGAKVYIQKWQRPLNVKTNPRNTRAYSPFTLCANAIKNCAEIKIHNHSWGNVIRAPKEKGHRQLEYEPALDSFTFGNEEHLVIACIGNQGRLMSANSVNMNNPQRWFNRQISAWTASKNSLIIGATWSFRDMDPSDAELAPHGVPIYDDSKTHEGDPVGLRNRRYGPCGKEPLGTICSFSNKGPTADNYMKPDLVAPGAGILSAFSEHPAAQARKEGRRDKDSPLYNSNYCHFPEMQFGSGTSASAPLVAGIAACVRSALRKKHCNKVLASTLRAILINTAKSLEGKTFFYQVSDPTAADPLRTTARPEILQAPPDCIQGFGEANYRRALIPITENPRTTPSTKEGYGWTGYHQVDKFSAECLTDRGQTWPPAEVFLSDTDPRTMASCIYWDVNIANENTQLRVTLAWNDVKGAQLQYELQLQVVQQVFSSPHADGSEGTWTEVAIKDEDKIKDYPAMDDWMTGDQRKVLPGTIRKVTWTGIQIPPLGPVPQKMRFQMRVRVLKVPSGRDASSRFGFSLCWLASKDADF